MSVATSDNYAKKNEELLHKLRNDMMNRFVQLKKNADINDDAKFLKLYHKHYDKNRPELQKLGEAFQNIVTHLESIPRLSSKKDIKDIQSLIKSITIELNKYNSLL